MNGGFIRRPVGTIQVIAVFGKPRQVHDAEIGTAGGGALQRLAVDFIFMVRCRLAQVIKTRPDEFAADKRILFNTLEIRIRNIRPVCGIDGRKS